ncbi:MAG: glutamine--tRNA ligase/YqeY domain fusion protein [Victivallales bacterium]|nr:glutamine--tRNA ligase/YqeY domain fusion protein [Victivallales bacterium]
MSELEEKSMTSAPTDFIRDIVREDLASGKYTPDDIRTRFPPEPNGYLHIGHAKAICLDFGIAKEFGGKCNLRMDDTNPGKEDREYYDSIQEDIAWLGYEWDGEVKFASDYFPKMYEFAIILIKKGLAYVDDQSAEEIRATRGTPFEPGKESPWRNRSVEENLDLFERMKNGEFPNGSKTLRAKIDMANPNINFRDPVMYRILHEAHQRTGNQWCIYPMYDWAHGLEDSLEGVTHSLCTLEFEIHRPLYNWFLEPLPIPRKPRQIEFSRLNLTYTVMSKRKLLRLVQEKFVSGWDDPRMPTVRGLRRRGYTPGSIRNFVASVGITKFNGVTDVGILENTLREELNHEASRYMAVLHPLKVVITNYPEGQIEWLDAVNNPEKPEAGTRQIPFGREIYIEQDDFKEIPPPKYFRLTVGKEVRLRWGYFIKCDEVVKDDAGNIVELRCTYDPETRGGNAPDGRKVKGTIHWVEASHAATATVREYDRLFQVPEPDVVPEGHDFTENLNPDSLRVLEDVKIEAGLAKLAPESRVQFERQGYFVADRYDHSEAKPVFNKIVGLKDSWAKIVQKEAGK